VYNFPMTESPKNPSDLQHLRSFSKEENPISPNFSQEENPISPTFSQEKNPISPTGVNKKQGDVLNLSEDINTSVNNVNNEKLLDGADENGSVHEKNHDTDNTSLNDDDSYNAPSTLLRPEEFQEEFKQLTKDRNELKENLTKSRGQLIETTRILQEMTTEIKKLQANCTSIETISEKKEVQKDKLNISDDQDSRNVNAVNSSDIMERILKINPSKPISSTHSNPKKSSVRRTIMRKSSMFISRREKREQDCSKSVSSSVECNEIRTNPTIESKTKDVQVESNHSGITTTSGATYSSLEKNSPLVDQKTKTDENLKFTSLDELRGYYSSKRDKKNSQTRSSVESKISNFDEPDSEENFKKTDSFRSDSFRGERSSTVRSSKTCGATSSVTSLEELRNHVSSFPRPVLNKIGTPDDEAVNKFASLEELRSHYEELGSLPTFRRLDNMRNYYVNLRK